MMYPSRRTFLRAAAIAVAAASGGASRATTVSNHEVSPTGEAVAALKPFDDLMVEFLRTHEVPGASLAVARGGRLVYARGFGVADPASRRPVLPTSLFRIASIAKPITAVAVLRLAEQGKLALDEPILKYLPPDLAAGGAERDERLTDVTVRHCLQHRGGWDRDRSGDPIASPRAVAAALGIPYPVTPAAVVRYTLGRPLDFDPGARFAYSNVGYLLLGRAIAAVSGMEYEAFVRAQLLAPLGVTSMALNRALPEDRPADEVSYLDRSGRTGRCVYPPKVDQRVPIADGAMNVEAFEAHGGWVATATDLVRFAAAFDDPARCPLLGAGAVADMFARPEGAAGFEADGKPKGAYYGCGWMVRPVTHAPGKANHWHAGLLLPGTSTLLVRRWDGLNWAVLFNTDMSATGGELAGHIDPLIHGAADAVSDWPAGDGPLPGVAQ